MFILGPATASYETVRQALVRKKASTLFTDTMFPALWDAALTEHVNPVGMVAQSAKETAWGRYTGVLSAAWMNTCGLKVRNPESLGLQGDTDYERFAHQVFPSWEIGALAHAQHLIAYTGCDVPVGLVDPRFDLIRGRYALQHFAELSGRWAASSTYGSSIESLMTDLHQG